MIRTKRNSAENGDFKQSNHDKLDPLPRHEQDDGAGKHQTRHAQPTDRSLAAREFSTGIHVSRENKFGIRQ